MKEPKAGLPDPQELIEAIERGDTARADEIRRQAREALPDAMAKKAERDLDRLVPLLDTD